VGLVAPRAMASDPPAQLRRPVARLPPLPQGRLATHRRRPQTSTQVRRTKVKVKARVHVSVTLQRMKRAAVAIGWLAVHRQPHRAAIPTAEVAVASVVAAAAEDSIRI